MVENILTDNTTKKNFDFVDSIRSIAMMFIVLEHSVYGGTYIFSALTPKNLIYMSIFQFTKIGTIIFFLLAGFLIGSKFREYTALEYFKRRLATTVYPWVIWSLLFLITMSIRDGLETQHNPDFNLIDLILSSFKKVYLYSNYWFIINFLICIALLLLFKKNLYSIWLGICFACFTLTYSINTHYEWFPPMHTTAIFGFVFFLWLGAQLNKNWDNVELLIKKFPVYLLALLYILAFYLSVKEVSQLYLAHSEDPFNTLRITNIFYSLISFTILLRIKNFHFTKRLKPRETTFGIFLIHYIIVYNVVSVLSDAIGIPKTADLSVLALFIVSIVRFAVVYSLTFWIVTLINKSRFKFLIGR